jgi:hypothetical protein
MGTLKVLTSHSLLWAVGIVCLSVVDRPVLLLSRGLHHSGIHPVLAFALAGSWKSIIKKGTKKKRDKILLVFISIKLD